jgi:hypothetical protein
MTGSFVDYLIISVLAMHMLACLRVTGMLTTVMLHDRTSRHTSLGCCNHRQLHAENYC